MQSFLMSLKEYFIMLIFEMYHNKTRNVTFVFSDDYDQPEHLLFITKFLSTYIHIQNTHTYATGIGFRLGLSLPSPVGITVTIHGTNQYIKVTCIIHSIYVYTVRGENTIYR